MKTGVTEISIVNPFLTGVSLNPWESKSPAKKATRFPISKRGSVQPLLEGND